jgi:RNA polymerase sigma-70 factor, ECF subfamily
MSATIPRNLTVRAPCPASAVLIRVIELQGAALFRRACKLTRTQADAWDLLQDTLLRALQHGLEYVPAEKAGQWLFVVMSHLHIDGRRKAKQTTLVPLDETNAPADEHWSRAEPPEWHSFEYEDVQRCLSRLSPRVRETYLLHEEQGLTLAATARRLSVPIATAGTRVYRARRQLRVMLTRRGDESGGDR